MSINNTSSPRLSYTANYAQVQSAQSMAMTKVTVRSDPEAQASGQAANIKSMNETMIKRLGTHLNAKA